MTPLPTLYAFLTALVLALATAPRLLRGHPGRLDRANYAGRQVPAVLGLALVGSVGTASVIAAFANLGGLYPVLLAVPLIVAIGAAGFLDDMVARGPRGLRGHLESMARGHMTTGILKVVVGVGAAVLAAAALGGGPVRVIAAVVVMASCTNLWNALDVGPGRAVKWGVLAAILLLAASWRDGLGVLLAATVGGSLAVLPFDLAERGMLGDAGSNPLGFVVGLGLAALLPTPWLVVTAVAALALQIAAETVTLSRLIEAVPPLRWFDGLGRRST